MVKTQKYKKKSLNVKTNLYEVHMNLTSKIKLSQIWVKWQSFNHQDLEQTDKALDRAWQCIFPEF